MTKVTLRKLTEAGKFEVNIEFNKRLNTCQPVKLTGNPKAIAVFKQDAQVATGIRGISLDSECMSYNDLRCALSRDLALWKEVSKPHEVQPEESIPEGMVW